MTKQSISIGLLCDYPQLAAAVGEIRWKEWGHPPEPIELGWWIDITRREAGRAQLPVTWVAIDQGGDAVGAVGLAPHDDVVERRHHSPWLVGMIVAPMERNQGIGGRLVATLEGWAKQQGYPQVWVATGGRVVAFYQKCGWHHAEVIAQPSGETIKVLTKVL
jgi:GNAT superfamily N-acetyltransferase